MRNNVLIAIMLACGCLLSAGCSSNAKYTTPEQLDHGMVIILPGIEGVSGFNRDIREGLVKADVDYAIPIETWGWHIPVVGLAINQVDIIGHILAGKSLAKKIVAYQTKYPHRPVFIISHSGGSGVAIFALEALADIPNSKPIEGAILLSPSLSADYDLTKALQFCRLGIVNFYNERDVVLLGLGTTLLGNVDGGHGASAGRSGFDTADSGDSRAKQIAYTKLFQVELTPAMTRNASGTSHSVNTSVEFVDRYVARWVTASSWPAE